MLVDRERVRRLASGSTIFVPHMPRRAALQETNIKNQQRCIFAVSRGVSHIEATLWVGHFSWNSYRFVPLGSQKKRSFRLAASPIAAKESQHRRRPEMDPLAAVRRIQSGCHAPGYEPPSALARNDPLCSAHHNGSFLASVEALGQRACRAGYQATYVSANEMLTQRRAARADTSLERKMLRFTSPELLVIDDLGLRPLVSDEPVDLYEIIRKRYERASTIITSRLFGSVCRDPRLMRLASRAATRAY